MNLFHPFSSQLLFYMGFHTYIPKNLFFSLLAYETVLNISTLMKYLPQNLYFTGMALYFSTLPP